MRLRKVNWFAPSWVSAKLIEKNPERTRISLVTGFFEPWRKCQIHTPPGARIGAVRFVTAAGAQGDNAAGEIENVARFMRKDRIGSDVS